jgi:hypothetical protein
MGVQSHPAVTRLTVKIGRRRLRSRPMRRFTLVVAFLVCGLLCAAMGAAAQDGVSAFFPPTPINSAPALPSGFATTPWQLTVGYQYNRIAVPSIFGPFSTSGPNASLTRYFGSLLGVEAEAGSGVGMAAPGVFAYSLFAGAGPRLAFRGRKRRFEPWVHGLAGVEHFNFGRAPFPGNTTSAAWVLGGGLDYRFDFGFALRVQGDYLGSLLGGAYQRNVQIVSALVWNF